MAGFGLLVGAVSAPVAMAAGAASVITSIYYKIIPETWQIKIWDKVFDSIDAIGNGIRELGDDAINAFMNGLLPMGLRPIDKGVRVSFNGASTFLPRVDPLILDLDGDGIETVGTDRGVLFDHDGDGVKSGTGWVSADDGFLVYDKNNDGVINNGGELFGDFTRFANGSRA